MTVDKISEVLRYCASHCDTEDETAFLSWVAEKFALEIARENVAFDMSGFLRSCGH